MRARSHELGNRSQISARVVELERRARRRARGADRRHAHGAPSSTRRRRSLEHGERSRGPPERTRRARRRADRARRDRARARRGWSRRSSCAASSTTRVAHARDRRGARGDVLAALARRRDAPATITFALRERRSHAQRWVELLRSTIASCSSDEAGHGSMRLPRAARAARRAARPRLGGRSCRSSAIAFPAELQSSSSS